MASHSVTHPSVYTQAGAQTAVAIVTVCAGFVAEQPSPAGLTRALSVERMTAGVGRTRQHETVKQTLNDR